MVREIANVAVPPTHSDSSGERRRQSSHFGRCHSRHPHCCTGTSCTCQSAGRRRRCPTCRCCCCSGTADSGHRIGRGCRSNLGRTPHNEHLQWQEKNRGQRSGVNTHNKPWKTASSTGSFTKVMSTLITLLNSKIVTKAGSKSCHLRPSVQTAIFFQQVL